MSKRATVVWGTVIPYPKHDNISVAAQNETKSLASFGDSSLFEDSPNNGVTNE